MSQWTQVDDAQTSVAEHAFLARRDPQAQIIRPPMADTSHESRNMLSRWLSPETNMTGYAAHKVTVHKGLL